MEIMLGMAQEEQIPCLLCVLPRCICHINLDIFKTELKLRKLEAGVQEDDQENEETKEQAEGDQDQEVLEESTGVTSKLSFLIF